MFEKDTSSAFFAIIIMKQFLEFIYKGRPGQDRRPVQDFIVLFIILLVVRYGIIIGKALLMGEDFTDFSENKEKLNIETVLSYVLLIPLIEELLFRGFLDLRRSRNLIVGIGLAALCAFFLFFRDEQYFFIVLFMIILLVYACLRIDAFYSILKGFVTRYYHLLAILSALIFAAFHITNYDDYSIYTFIPLVPRFISGLYLAYIISKYNIWYAWMMHAINNTTPFIILLVAEVLGK